MPKVNTVESHNFFGPEKLDDWLRWVDDKVARAKKKYKSADYFLEECKRLGLVISDEKVFLDIYWYNKRTTSKFVYKTRIGGGAF